MCKQDIPQQEGRHPQQEGPPGLALLPATPWQLAWPGKPTALARAIIYKNNIGSQGLGLGQCIVD